MYLVLLSGGSGKRLWPLSNDLRSKQYLRVLDDPYTPGKCVSMVQRIWAQLEHADLQSHTIICAGKAQEEILCTELGSGPIAIEPERRVTFPAVVLSCAYLVSEMGASWDDVVVFLPVDPYVDDNYFETIKRLEQTLSESDTDMVLMGATPTYPSSKYGYIVPEATHDSFLDVKGFTEKPDESTAQQLIAQGALWNYGVFCFRLRLMKEQL